MQMDALKGNWQRLRGVLKENWGTITNDCIMQCNGRRDRLVGKIRGLYGMSRTEAETALASIERQFRKAFQAAKTVADTQR
jgi:uncharacterized protein YjbJ (UPF0337 family)